MVQQTAVMIKKPFVKQGIYRHQTPPRYLNAARGSQFTVVVQPPRISVAPITAKCDVIYKTGSIQRIATLPEEDRATATGDLHIKFREDRSSGSRNVLADRQTDRHTHRQTDGLITILRTPTGAE